MFKNLMRNKFINILIFVQCLTIIPLAGNTAIINGKVINKYTKKGLYGCNVLVINTGKSCTTDTLGNFEISGLSSGKHKVIVKADTYYTEQYVIRTSKDDESINIFMLRNKPKPGYGILYGRILDEKTNKPISAVARSDKLNIGAIAEDEGNYIISDIPIGKHEILYTCMGYLPQKVIVNIIADKSKKLDIRLIPSNIEMN